MSPPSLSRSLHRALLLALATPAFAGQVGCGGNVVVDGAAGGATTGTTTGTTSSTGACTLLSPTPIGSGTCQEEYPLNGTPADCGVQAGGSLSTTQCLALCPVFSGVTSSSCTVDGAITGDPGNGVLTCVYGPCGTGRRPPGLVAAEGATRQADPVAAHLAEVAHLEAAAVIAFERLAAELRAHGAPDRLVRAARRSAREEVRHAETTGRLAAQAGASPEPVVVDAPPALRSLEALALDNAVEGCVRETYGALVAMHQALQARHPEVRREMEAIARDESRHAELSWEIAAWLDGRLDEAARLRVRRARDRAVEDLFQEIAADPHPTLVAEMGLPTAAQGRAAAADLRAALWT